MRFIPATFTTAIVLALISCKKDDGGEDNDTPPPGQSGPSTAFACDDNVPHLVLKFKFDSTQVRLNNLGLPAGIPAGHAAQHPRFNTMSAHYVEFAPTMWTALGAGDVLYHAAETSAGGANAIDFAQGVRVGDGETFLCLPLSDLAPGSYEWLRVSLAYQNYDIDFRYTYLGTPYDMQGTLASFIGFNTYIASFNVGVQPVAVNDDKLQGFWAFEVIDPMIPTAPITGQAPGTTVVNPLFDSSPIPAGSCVVTGQFVQPLTITGNETEDVVITVSLSTNNSFEWNDTATPDGRYEPAAGDFVVDMGVRGMIPIVE